MLINKKSERQKPKYTLNPISNPNQIKRWPGEFPGIKADTNTVLQNGNQKKNENYHKKTKASFPTIYYKVRRSKHDPINPIRKMRPGEKSKFQETEAYYRLPNELAMPIKSEHIISSQGIQTKPSIR